MRGAIMPHHRDQETAMTLQHALLVFGMLCSLVAAIVVNLVVPEFDEVYRNFGAELPWLTRMLLAGRWLLFALPGAALLAWWLTPVVPGRPNRRGLVALLVGVCLPLALVPLVVIGLYMPIFDMAGVGG
jgi:type II secretory pathway component PulF